ncbi:Glutaredoxin-2 [Providencia rettgeri]|nr:Glutaredoxin-2 [Providencia rettgeri]
MKLYVYDHCPFCVRARMIFGLKKLAVEQVFLLDDDKETPISMIGKKCYLSCKKRMAAIYRKA